MSVVEFEAIAYASRTPKAAFRRRLADFSQEEIDQMTLRDFEAIAFDLRAASGGAGLTDLYEQKMLDHIFSDPTWTPPTTLYIGVSSTTPTEAGGNITEPSTGNYARVATTSADWSAASGTAPAVKTNTATFTFPTATADWLSGTNITHSLLCATLAGTGASDFIAWGAMLTAKPVMNGDTVSFAPGSISVQMGDPGDTY